MVMADNDKKVALRISPELHERIAVLAKKNVRSINGQIAVLLAEAVAREEKKKSDD